MFLLLVRFGGEVITLNPENKNLTIGYKIWDGESVVKTGTLSIANEDKVKRKKYLQFTNKWIHDYLDAYDEHIKNMSKE